MTRKLLEQALEALEDSDRASDSEWGCRPCSSLIDAIREYLAQPEHEHELPQVPLALSESLYRHHIKEAWESGFRAGLREKNT